MSYNDRRVIVCIPYGRQRYVEVLLPYLLSTSVVDEVRLWMNTDVAEDLKYADELQAKEAKVKLVAAPSGALNKYLYPATLLGYPGAKEHYQFNDSVYRFYGLCVERGTIYVKMDDDISYVHEGFFEAMCSEVIERQPTNFAVLANVFNVPHTTKTHQTTGALTMELGRSNGSSRCPVACTNGPFAHCIHRQFLAAAEAHDLEKFFMASHEVTGRNRIGVLAWAGESMQGVEVGPADEKELTQRIPDGLGKPLWLAGKALCSHYAFSHQRGFLDDTDVLQKYAELMKVTLKLDAHAT